MAVTNRQGSLSINSENIFPIIKKWLYQDHDIFYRELISNGCDAITKLKKLSIIGEYEAPDDEKYRIDVTVDPDAATISFEDNGIGMTADEVDQYINQIAFSGAADFLEKYKDKANEDQIIGHFGLGFYSAFMVADNVTIDTLSYKKDAEPVLWESEDGSEFSMSAGTRTGHGTVITLHINDDELQFCNEYKAREVIEKYCSFMPVEIYLKDLARERREAEEAAKKAEEEAKKKAEEDKKKAEAGTVSVDGADAEASGSKDETKKPESASEPAAKEPEKKQEKPLNDTHPLWNESPSQVKEEQYKEFYRKVFKDFKEPLFWIHLNMDYPFNLKGILYFPKVNAEYENIEGTIKLYNNQVFIADNIKEVIPEYLLLLKGVIDCPDLPLNVSRSALQNDGFVKKISDYITKKVSEKLSGMFKTDRENYEKYWEDICPFIKYGCIKDSKFGDKMKDAVIFKDLNGKYVTVGEYLDGAKADEKAEETAAAENKTEGGAEPSADSVKDGADSAKTEADDAPAGDTREEAEKPKRTVYYVTDEKEQGQYIRMFKNAGQNAVIMPLAIDTPFISYVENKNENVSFTRIDSDVTDDFRDEAQKEEAGKLTERLTTVFRKVLGNDKLDVKVESLKDESVASFMTMSEEGRRMQEMMKMYAAYGMNMGDMGSDEQTLILNSNNKTVKKLSDCIGDDGEANETGKLITEQLYDMALLSRNGLSDERMANFIKRSQELLMRL